MKSDLTNNAPTILEKPYVAKSGWGVLIGSLTVLGIAVAMFITGCANENGFLVIPSLFLFVAAVVVSLGLVAIQPNSSRVLLLFGDYQGTLKESGFYWVNPFFSKKKVSLRIRNFETGATSTPEQKDSSGTVVQKKGRTAGRPSKVNDRDGNPIDISAVVVWKVVDTAEALFEVDDYEDFVRVQSEAALRNLATRHPYDSEDHEISLRGSTTEVSEQLEHDIQERLHKAGVKVIEARISHLAYSQEIAAAMLQRQQAGAVVAARTKIVDGAVGMVKMALDQLSDENIVELDDKSRAQMVSNLLVVLCSDRHAQPVINAGGG
jgi:regulator of protease activity HflC (stomatin/prohibitin superfamily)